MRLESLSWSVHSWIKLGHNLCVTQESWAKIIRFLGAHRRFMYEFWLCTSLGQPFWSRSPMNEKRIVLNDPNRKVSRPIKSFCGFCVLLEEKAFSSFDNRRFVFHLSSAIVAEPFSRFCCLLNVLSSNRPRFWFYRNSKILWSRFMWIYSRREDVSEKNKSKAVTLKTHMACKRIWHRLWNVTAYNWFLPGTYSLPKDIVDSTEFNCQLSTW